MSEYSDVELVCSDCNQTFVFSAEEQERYASRNFSEPKRCPECRQNRRTQHRQAPRRFGGGGGGGGGGYGGGGGGYGGGGGGSSYSSGPILVNTQGVRSGNGQVIISWTGSVTCPSNPRVPVTVTVSSPTVTASASVNPLCEGSSTILTGGGAVSYIWTGGVTDGVSFAPLATNTYTVTGTDGVGCTATSSITVTVNPLSPTPSPVTATPSVICVGGNSDLNAVSVGNTINWYTVPSGGVAIGTV
ncbi:MAG TPA: zinc-ribbon domain containing protein, partial [Planctomycetota bacterium]|nr:zinc-ribbon domain containing protein [Planctomycetota bacterium]